MAVEFYELDEDNEYVKFGALRGGEVVEDVDGAMSDFMDQFVEADGINWGDPVFLTERFNGPYTVAHATGADADRVEASIEPSPDSQPGGPEPREDVGGIVLEEVGGDRTFKSRAVHMAARAGRYIIREAPGDDADLILTIKATGETIRLRETGENAAQPNR